MADQIPEAKKYFWLYPTGLPLQPAQSRLGEQAASSRDVEPYQERRSSLLLGKIQNCQVWILAVRIEAADMFVG